MRKTYTRDSQLYVTCRSIRKRNWLNHPFWDLMVEMTSKWQKSRGLMKWTLTPSPCLTDTPEKLRTKDTGVKYIATVHNHKRMGSMILKRQHLPFCPLNHCKSSDQELWKGTIKWLVADERSWFQSQMLQKAIYQWLPLDITLVHILTHNTAQQIYVHACTNVMWEYFLTKLLQPN